VRFFNVTVWVSDPVELRDWYQKHLGFRCTSNSDRFVLLEGDGGAAIAFHAGTPVGRPQSVQFHVEVDDLDHVFREMTANGVEFESQPKVQPWGVRSVACSDPAGHSVELVQKQ
jgi:catechol 2,3-dioxygenase-like lactoylglutathione lyase family enzyme